MYHNCLTFQLTTLNKNQHKQTNQGHVPTHHSSPTSPHTTPPPPPPRKVAIRGEKRGKEAPSEVPSSAKSTRTMDGRVPQKRGIARGRDEKAFSLPVQPGWGGTVIATTSAYVWARAWSWASWNVAEALTGSLARGVLDGDAARRRSNCRWCPRQCTSVTDFPVKINLGLAWARCPGPGTSWACCESEGRKVREQR